MTAPAPPRVRAPRVPAAPRAPDAPAARAPAEGGNGQSGEGGSNGSGNGSGSGSGGEGGDGGGDGGSRSVPVPARAPAPPLISSPTGFAPADCVADAINAVAAPFQQGPDPALGTAGAVAHWTGAALGVVGAIQNVVDTGFAALTAPLAKLWPSMPAVTLGVLHVGTPHTHAHPPSLIPPAPPIPLPSLGMLVGSGAVTVLICGMPAARAGDVGLGVTCGSLAPPFEVFTGSSNVFIGGARAARAGDITKHCNPSSMGPFAIAMGLAGVVAGGAGAIAKNDSFAMAQAIADAAVLALKLLCGKDPAGPPGMGVLTVPFYMNVMIGGFPCPPIGEMAFGGVLKALQKAARGMKKKFSSRRNNTSESDCGDPVNPATGEVFAHYTDFVSTGLFRWHRYYSTALSKERGPIGPGWRHFYQRRLRRRLHRATYIDWEGNRVEFPRFERGSNVTRSDGYVLERLAPGYFELARRGEPAMQFVGGEFDSELRLHRMLTEEGELEFEQDAAGRLRAVTETDSNGDKRRFELSYTETGMLQQIVEHDADETPGHVKRQPAIRVSNRHAAWGGLESVTNAVGGNSYYEYDGFNRLTKQTDACKYSFSYRYDTLGRCVETKGQDGMLECQLEYFPDDKYTRVTEAGESVWEYHYDDDGVITKIVDPCGGVKKRELDGEGRLSCEIDSGGRELHWLYDENGVHYARRDRFGYLYPPHREMPVLANPHAPRLPNASLGWLLNELAPVRAEAALGIDVRQLDTIPAELKSQAYACFRTREPGASDGAAPELAPRIKYSPLGHRISELDARGRERRWEYDAEGHCVAERDRDGNLTREAIVSWKSIGERVDGERRAMKYEYSRRDQITKITDPLGLESQFDYDLKGRLVRVHRHGRVREEYVYDQGDHFIEKRDGQGRVLFTNESHENHFVGTRTLASGGTHHFDYDARGRVTVASTEAHAVELAYDSSGRRSLDRRDGKGVEHSIERAGVAFDERLVWRTRVLERFEQTRTPSAPSTLRLTDPAGGQTRVEVGEAGLVTRYASNGTTELLQYDEAGRLEARFAHRRDRFNQDVAWTTRYTYSGEGDLLRVADSARGDSTYDVDAAHRLVAEHTPDGKLHTYFQDPAGNLLERPGLSVRALTSGNRLASTKEERFSYDDRDHLSERYQRHDGSTIRYVYDSFDMLLCIEHGDTTLTWPPRLSEPDYAPPPDGGPPRLEPGQTWRAAYDALGRRLWTQLGPHRREFYWDGDRLAAEILHDGQLRIYQYASSTALVPLAFTDYENVDASPASGKTYHVFSDPVGMPLCIEDEAGRVAWWARRVDPYGLIDVRPDAKLEYNLRWPGHYYDPETGLHYNRHRYYDPKLGRYLQCDPMGYSGSPVNLYSYCKNPLVHVDVLGLHAKEDADATDPNARQGEADSRQEGTNQADADAAAQAAEAARRRALGEDPAVGRYRANEEATAVRVEGAEGATLERFQPAAGQKGDWVNPANGQVYDGCSPAPTAHFDRSFGGFERSLGEHLAHPTVDKVVVDVTGLNLSEPQMTRLQNHINSLPPAEQAKIVKLGF